jgi:hypothetical protein
VQPAICPIAVAQASTDALVLLVPFSVTFGHEKTVRAMQALMLPAKFACMSQVSHCASILQNAVARSVHSCVLGELAPPPELDPGPPSEPPPPLLLPLLEFPWEGAPVVGALVEHAAPYAAAQRVSTRKGAVLVMRSVTRRSAASVPQALPSGNERLRSREPGLRAAPPQI